ncbi:MAG TPA: VCBS repeat-containing protein, partial [Myxococcales bacterium]|nr:VCBS repeat-containing protein [Myxococcales bacterium]
MKQFLSVALIFTLACGSSSQTAPNDTASDIGQDADTKPTKEHHPAWGSPLPQIALPTFGQALHVGTQAIEFTDISLESGLPIEGGADTVTFADIDSDGWPDIVANAENGFSFYRNVGGSFEEITDELLLFDSENVRKSGTLAVFADINGDGALDVYVAARGGADQLLVNDGYGHFELHDASAVLDPSESVQGVHFADINNDGLLDLYVTEGRRVDADKLEPPLENGFAGLPNKLFLGDGNFHFENVTSEWNATAGATSESFGGLFADMDR